MAAGTQVSTIFALSENEFAEMAFTANDLQLAEGESMFGLDGKPSDAAKTVIKSRIASLFFGVLNAVLFNCLYETFWCDSGQECFSYGWSYSWNSRAIYVSNVTVLIRISEVYRDPDADNPSYTVNRSLIESVHNAASTAQGIAAQYAGLSDYQKLTAYEEKICELTSYNTEAANNKQTPYGNPWQLVWVFDGIDSTTVVCEGYSKAFQVSVRHEQLAERGGHYQRDRQHGI